jgi:hypothetical protein
MPPLDAADSLSTCSRHIEGQSGMHSGVHVLMSAVIPLLDDIRMLMY